MAIGSQTSDILEQSGTDCKGAQETGVQEMYVSTGMKATWVPMFVKIHQNKYLKFVHFISWKLYFNKVS